MTDTQHDDCGCEINTERDGSKSHWHDAYCLLPYKTRKDVEADKEHILFHMNRIIQFDDFEEEFLHKILTESDFADGISDLMVEQVRDIPFADSTILFLMMLHLSGDKFNVSPFVDRARTWNSDLSQLPETWVIKYYAGEHLKRSQWGY